MDDARQICLEWVDRMQFFIGHMELLVTSPNADFPHQFFDVYYQGGQELEDSYNAPTCTDEFRNACRRLWIINPKIPFEDLEDDEEE